MKTNPEWKPYLDTLEKAAKHLKPHVPIAIFLTSHLKRLQPTVALGLTLAKWYLRHKGTSISTGMPTCGCCIYYAHSYMGHGGCISCVLNDDEIYCAEGTDAHVYNRALKAYTTAFNALAARDRQTA